MSGLAVSTRKQILLALHYTQYSAEYIAPRRTPLGLITRLEKNWSVLGRVHTFATPHKDSHTVVTSSRYVNPNPKPHP